MCVLPGTRTNDVVAQFASMAFDISQRDLFLAWTVGGCLVSIPPGLVGHDLATTLVDEKVTVLNCVPSLLRSFSEKRIEALQSHLRIIYTAGEPLLPEVTLACKLKIPANTHVL